MLGTDSILDDGSSWWVVILGRVKSGISTQQVEANFEPVLRPAALAGWTAYVASLTPPQRGQPAIAEKGSRVPRLRVVSASHGIADLEETTTLQLGVLSAIFGVMLLIVCANLTNLLLARAAARTHEVSVRLAIGASRGRVMRQLMIESLVLGAFGGAVAWPVAVICRSLMPESLGVATLAPDGLVVAFACALSVLSAAALGLVPAWWAVRSAHGLASPAARTRVHSSGAIGKPMMAGQIALSMVLVVAAVLFSRTLINLQRVEVGFDADRLATFMLEPGRSGYDRPRAEELYARLEERLRGIPGVRAVAIAGSGSGMLWGTDSNADVFLLVGVDRGESKYQFVDVNFFDTIGIRLRRGRLFTAQDTATSTRVAIVSETFAREFFAGPIHSVATLRGRHRLPSNGSSRSSGSSATARSTAFVTWRRRCSTGHWRRHHHQLARSSCARLTTPSRCCRQSPMRCTRSIRASRSGSSPRSEDISTSTSATNAHSRSRRVSLAVFRCWCRRSGCSG